MSSGRIERRMVVSSTIGIIHSVPVSDLKSPSSVVGSTGVGLLRTKDRSSFFSTFGSLVTLGELRTEITSDCWLASWRDSVRITEQVW